MEQESEGMTDFEMDKTYTITGREFLALLSLIPDGTEKAKTIVENVAGREKSVKVNESQIDILKPCPLCGGNAVWVGDYLTTTILCQDCGLELNNDDWDLNNSADIRSKMVKKWNRRVKA